MKIKQNLIICFGMALVLMTLGTASAGTFTVNNSTGPVADFTSIQVAVDDVNTTNGTTILVYPGVYTENVNVNKELIIISESGNPADTIVQPVLYGHIFHVTVDNVNISGFKVADAIGKGTVGIYLDRVEGCNVTNNNASNNWHGIWLRDSSNNTLSNNTAKSNIYTGLYLWGSSDNTLNNNTASDNGLGISLYHSGIFLLGSSNNTLTNNNLSNNGEGIELWDSSNNTLNNNTASNNTYGIRVWISSYTTLTDNSAYYNDYGIALEESNNNTLINNTANSNNLYNGIYLESSSNNTLTSNTALYNRVGIYLYTSSNNNLTSNTASNNVYDGIYLVESSDNNLNNNTANLNNDDGIWLHSSYSNRLTNNTANLNNGQGIYLRGSSSNMLSSNIVSNNDGNGICLDYWIMFGIPIGSNDNILNNNIVYNNTVSGIVLERNFMFQGCTTNNTIYNNIFNNTNNTQIPPTTGNIWNITQTTGPNIIGGPFLGGNYWAKPDGTGFSQINVDTDGDGFCDSPYNIDKNNIDYLPLADTLPPADKLTITVTCPVDLEVVDPDGLIINKQTNQIPGAIYTETDINGDGDPDDCILIPNPKAGNYQIEIIPEEDATDTDTYTLGVSVGDTSLIICEDALVDDIPDQPYTAEVKTDGEVSFYPIADAGGPYDPVEVNSSIIFNGSGSYDPDGAIVSYKWDFGDESTATVMNPTHAYGETGVYTVTLNVTDNDGYSNTEVYQYVIVYDPDGGFVTGGGWIESPAGAYMADTSLEGKANFGFVSKYVKNKDYPVGNTEFQFHAGDLNFHSDSYDWLVVNKHKAIYKGTGTINGDGNYGFMLSAIDAERTPSTDVDLFRIKIWDKDDNDAVVYDNMLGEDEGEDPTTAIQGGAIKAHAKK